LPVGGDRHNLAQHFNPFSGKVSRLARQAGDVAAGLRQAGDETHADRVPRDGEDDRDD
jgi:hypothetical protein